MELGAKRKDTIGASVDDLFLRLEASDQMLRTQTAAVANIPKLMASVR